MATLKKKIGRLPVYKGDWVAGTYSMLNQVSYLGSTFQSKIDNNTAIPATVVNNALQVNANWSVVSNGTAAYLAGERLTATESRMVQLEQEVNANNEAIQHSLCNNDNLLNDNNNKKDTWINNNGDEVYYESWECSEFINVKPNTSYMLAVFEQSGNQFKCINTICFYDNDLKKISYHTDEISVLSPTNAKYVKVSYESGIYSWTNGVAFGESSYWMNAQFDKYVMFGFYLSKNMSVDDNVKKYVSSVSGTGLIYPLSYKDGNIVVKFAERAIINYVIQNDTGKAVSIDNNTEYLLSAYKALVIDSNDNTVKIISAFDVTYSHVVLLMISEINDNYAKYAQGWLTTRYAIDISYEEYDYHNVRKSYARAVDDKIVDCEKITYDFASAIHTDLHYTDKTIPCINAINWIDASINLDAIFNLGDMIATGREADLNLSRIQLQNSVAKINNRSKLIACVGNHDYNHVSEAPTDRQKKEWIIPYADVQRAIGRHLNGNVIWGNKDRMYYYKDYEENKVRVIVLNTLDRPEEWVTVDGVDYDKYTWLDNIVGSAQLNWLVDTALNFGDKSDKSEWHTIVLSHVSAGGSHRDQSDYLEWTDAALSNRVIIRQVLEAFIQGSPVTLSYTDDVFDGYASTNRKVDFTTQGAMKLVGMFSGHSHIDTHRLLNGVNYITTVCAYPYNIGDSNSMSGLSMVDGTLTEFGIDVLLLDKFNRKCNLKRIGVGDDRSFSY